MSFRDGRKATISVADDADTIQTVDVPDCDIGMLVEAKIVIPDCLNAITFTFSILDRQDHVRYSIALLPENDKSIILPNRMIQRGYKFGMTPSAVSGTDIDIDIYPTYEV